MQMIMLASKTQVAEWFSEGLPEGLSIVHDAAELKKSTAEVIIDLLYEDQDHEDLIADLDPSVFLILGSVIKTTGEVGRPCVRINSWPHFLAPAVLEGAGPTELQERANEVLKALGRQVEWVADEPGMVSPRVISMIINEAFMAEAEGVSSRDDIDTAMKLGTNYPYGPFQWAEQIGLKNIHNLLSRLAEDAPKYQPSFSRP